MRLGGRVVGVLAGDGVVGADYFDWFAVAGCSVVGEEKVQGLALFEVTLYDVQGSLYRALLGVSLLRASMLGDGREMSMSWRR